MTTWSLSARQGKPAATTPDRNASCPWEPQLESLFGTAGLSGQKPAPATYKAGEQDGGDTEVSQGHLELSLGSLILLHIPSFRDHSAKLTSAQRRKKAKLSRAIFEPKKSHLLSVAEDTNQNPVSPSAGAFPRGVGFHLGDTLAPICLPSLPGAAKCWGGASVFICEFLLPAPSRWSRCRREPEMVLLGQKRVAQAAPCPSTKWSHKFLWISCHHVCLSSWMLSVHQQLKHIVNFIQNRSKGKTLISYQRQLGSLFLAIPLSCWDTRYLILFFHALAACFISH